MFKKKTTRSALVLFLVLALAAPVISAVSALPGDPVAALTAAIAAEPTGEDASAVAEEEAATVAAVEETPAVTYDQIRINGQPMTQDPMITDVNGQTYVGIRPVALALDPEVGVYWKDNVASLLHWEKLELTAVPGANYVVANDRYLYLPNGVQTGDGAVLLPLETLCKVFDATCVAQEDGTFDITTGSGALLPASQYYNSDDLYWLSHIISAESGNQPLVGKIAVGNVVLNRVSDSRFPNSIYSVVFQKSQFTPAATGAVHRNPTSESVIAAKLCLDGAVALDNVLYFNQTGLRCWNSQNRPFVATIAGHSFYA